MEYFGHMQYGVIMWLIIAGFVLYLFSTILRSGKDIHSSDSALDILKKRYAAGEISKDDFNRMEQELMR